jgi:hypothetical protein
MVFFSNNNSKVNDVDGGIESTKCKKKKAPTSEITLVTTIAVVPVEEAQQDAEKNDVPAVTSAAEERDDVVTTTTTADSCSKVEAEAYKEDEHTPLFLSIQGCDWKNAMIILGDERGQRQVRIWATSLTLDCVGVPTWRRLPIHEACRRQAPAYVVDALLKADPRSAQLKTHFSELPIHIACGFGASEEVIGILLSAYPDGIVEIDQAKRTPLDCFLMARRPKDSVTFRSMERCIAYISERNKALEKATEKIGTEHAAQVANLEKNLLEQEKKTMLEISSLQNVISEKKLLIDNLESSLRSCQDTLELKLQVEAALTETVAHLENTNEVAQAKISHCITNIKELNTAIEDKDCQMVFLTDKVKKTEAQVVLLMDTQKKLENHAAKRKVYAKKEEQEWKNMLSLMESQRKTAEETFEQLLST